MLLEALITLVLLFLILGLLVFVHEFGHFLAAKLIKVEVEEFAFGFGKNIWQKEYKETVYKINLLPLGGYVKVLGDEDPSSFKRFQAGEFTKNAINSYAAQLDAIHANTGSLISRIKKIKASSYNEEEKKELLDFVFKYLLIKDPNSFDNKSAISKLFVYVAGVMMNMIIAILIFSLYFVVTDFKADITYIAEYPFIGVDEKVYEKPIVAHVYNTKLSNQGFNVTSENQGILLTKIDGQTIEDETSFTTVWNSVEGKEVEVEYIFLNEGKVQSKTLEINTPGYDLNLEPKLQDKVVFAEILENTSASRAGIQAKDILLSLDSKEANFEKAQDFVDFLEAHQGQDVTFEVLTETGEIKTLQVSLITKQGDEPILGARFQINTPFTVPLYHLDYSDSKALAGVYHSVNILGYNPVALAKILSVSFETRDVELASQSVSSIWGVGERLNILVVSRDYKNIINLVGLISVALAFMNILPIPLLDGGQILFLAIEKIKGSPLKLSTQERIAKISFVLLIAFSILIVLKDIWIGFIGTFIRDIL